jgi:hypothetical protein
MMKAVLLAAALCLVGSVSFAKDTYVNGYTKKDGTYVEPHHRSGADSTTTNNYSTKGNVNPYTGKAGTKNVYDNNSSSSED